MSDARILRKWSGWESWEKLNPGWENFKKLNPQFTRNRSRQIDSSFLYYLFFEKLRKLRKLRFFLDFSCRTFFFDDVITFFIFIYMKKFWSQNLNFLNPVIILRLYLLVRWSEMNNLVKNGLSFLKFSQPGWNFLNFLNFLNFVVLLVFKYFRYRFVGLFAVEKIVAGLRKLRKFQPGWDFIFISQPLKCGLYCLIMVCG